MSRARTFRSPLFSCVCRDLFTMKEAGGEPNRLGTRGLRPPRAWSRTTAFSPPAEER